MEKIPVTMIRETLEGIPSFPLPPPYRARWYEPGDKEAWLRIHVEADLYNDIAPDLFDREFGRDESLLSERMCFLLDEEGLPFATASAWFDSDYHGGAWGRVHWVAVLPHLQGRGLSKPLLSLVCERMVELGHARAYLTTATVRVPAIRLYLRFGFVPDIRNPGDLARWRTLLGKIPAHELRLPREEDL
ncbi:MAG: GNAT family N-acetyltransferase [Planctomycetota bacterium]